MDSGRRLQLRGGPVWLWRVCPGEAGHRPKTGSGLPSPQCPSSTPTCPRTGWGTLGMPPTPRPCRCLRLQQRLVPIAPGLGSCWAGGSEQGVRALSLAFSPDEPAAPGFQGTGDRRGDFTPADRGAPPDHHGAEAGACSQDPGPGKCLGRGPQLGNTQARGRRPPPTPSLHRWPSAWAESSTWLVSPWLCHCSHQHCGPLKGSCPRGSRPCPQLRLPPPTAQCIPLQAELPPSTRTVPWPCSRGLQTRRRRCAELESDSSEPRPSVQRPWPHSLFSWSRCKVFERKTRDLTRT